MVPRTVLTRSGTILINTARPVNIVQPRTTVDNAGPMKNVINNAYSTARRPFNKITTVNNSNFTKKVNTVKGTRVNNARSKVVLSAVKGNKGNAVKASACWGNPQQDLKNKGVIDSGCSRHMTGNRSYLTDYEEINGGFVAFGGNSKRGKITRKGKIKTGKLDFEDVYFVKELKFNLFSVSQMCDKKNNVLFTDTECVVLSPDFKLTDESHVLLKVPRKDNMYSIDLKNVGIKREFSVASTPQQNGVAERKNRTLIEASRTMLADSKLPTTFWAEAVNTACYVQNKVLVIKPHNKTPYELFLGKARMEIVPKKDYILLPMWPADPLFSQNSKDSPYAGFKASGEEEKKDAEDSGNESENQTKGKDSEVPSIEEPRINQDKDDNINSTNNINTASDGNNTNNVKAVSSTVNAAGIEINAVDLKTSIELPNDPNDPNMPELEDIVYSDDDEDVGAKADMNNLDAFMPVSPIPTTRINKDHPVEQVIRDLNSEPQTRRMIKNLKEHGLFSSVQQRTNHKDFQNYLFACFLSQEEPKKKDERGIVIKNKARLVAQRIKAIRLFLAYTSFKDFVVYQMDVKSAFLYGKIKDEVYVCQPPGFEDPDFLDRVYKLDDIIFGSTKKKLCTKFEKMMHKKFQMSSMGELTFFLGLQVKQKEDGIFISQDKYMAEILKKFCFSDIKIANTPMETHKPLLKDADGEDVDEHIYRSMIGSLMYLTSSRPYIMFAYLKDPPFDLVAYTDIDYAGASLDKKSTTGGCQFLRCRLILWQCKKQTVVANSTTEAEYDRSSYARAMIKLRADAELKDNIVAAMPKITQESYYTCNIHVEYEWKPLRCACCKVFGHVLEECPKNISAGATKNLKKTSKLRFVDDDGNPLVPTGIVDSDSEVEVIFDETANLRISKSGKDRSDKGYDTNSLLKQWRDSDPDHDNYDPCDDDMYENHDMSEHL
ncbi:putative ribonuclease H-like domain-containing protein [Tanacetum coccineum]|uniref:Ribonuclease H-like domain-containing protein n=1 Tax=Tanacetum coccineum TaxID=301880 RepID=A0ABQ5BBB3_9ASTR